MIDTNLDRELRGLFDEVAKQQQSIYEQAVTNRPAPFSRYKTQIQAQAQPASLPQSSTSSPKVEGPPGAGWWIACALATVFGLSAIMPDKEKSKTPSQPTPASVKQDNASAVNKFGGVGIKISIKNSFLKIDSVLPDMPAQQAGIRAGDILVLIDNRFLIRKMSLKEILEKLKGPVGSSVNLSVKRKGVPDLVEFAINRAEIIVPASSRRRPSISRERLVRVPRSSDRMFMSMESFGDDQLRSALSIDELRKPDRFSAGDLYLPIFQRDRAPRGRDVRNLHRLFNYGYCGTTEYYSSVNNRRIANIINACTQNYGAHFSVTSSNNISPDFLNFMYRYSSPKEYILFAIRDGRASSGDIQKIQSALNRVGISVGRADGVWGSRTANGLINFLQSQKDVFLDVSKGYLRKLKQHITDENREFITGLALSRARIGNPQLKKSEFILK